MDAFFDGARVHVEGQAEGAGDVLVTVVGEAHAQEFNRRLQVGPVWISSGRMRFSGVPSLWLSFSSRAAGSLLARAAIQEHLLDRQSLLSRIRIQPEPSDPALFQSEYMKRQAKAGIYAEFPESIRVQPAEGGRGLRYQFDFDWPKAAPPGSYRINVYAVSGGTVAGISSAPFEVVRVGLPSRIADFSRINAGWYGLLCILLAMGAGFGMDKLVSLLGGKRVGH